MTSEQPTVENKKLTKLKAWFSSRKAPGILVVLAISVIGSYLIINSLAATGDSMSLVPQSSTANIGSNFTVTLHEDSGTDPVNALQANLTYSSNLQFVSVDYSTGAFDIQAQSSGGSGKVSIARGVSSGPVTGDHIVAVITFKAIGGGTGSVTFGCINGSSCTNGNALVRTTDNANVLAAQTDGSYTLADVTAPSVPAGLAVTTHASTSLSISWTASTDDVGVASYTIYRDGSQVGTSSSTSFNDTSLTAGTAYTYTVSASDAAGNASAQSAGLQATTDQSGTSSGGSAQLYLSPASQTVASGSNLTLNVIVNSGSTSVNGVQSTIHYPANQFSYVSLTADPAFSAFPSPVLASGSVGFGAGSTTPLSGVHTVATLTLQATYAGSANISLESICTGTSSSSCSAVTDTNAANILSTIVGGNYTVTGGTTSGGSGNGSNSGSSGGSNPSYGGSSSSGSSKSSSGGSKPPTYSHGTTSTPTGGSTTVTPSNNSGSSSNTALEMTDIKITNITDTSATVTWQTNLPATSTVNYGLSPSYNLVAEDSNLTTSHSITLGAPNIAKGTAYAIQIVSQDQAGDVATSIQQFSTPGFDVTIKLTNNQNKPLAHASVTLGGKTETTDSNGQVVFKNVLGGSQKVTVKAGGKTTDQTIKVGEYDGATKSYKPQQFSLVASSGSSKAPYLFGGLAVVVIVAAYLLLPKFGLGRLFSSTQVQSYGHDRDLAGINKPTVPTNQTSSSETAPSSDPKDKGPGQTPGSIVSPHN